MSNLDDIPQTVEFHFADLFIRQERSFVLLQHASYPAKALRSFFPQRFHDIHIEDFL